MQPSNKVAKSTHRKTQMSTTLNRKYVKRPAKSSDVTVKVKKASKTTNSSTPVKNTKISHFHDTSLSSTRKESMPEDTDTMKVEEHPMHSFAKTKMQERYAMSSAPTPVGPSAKELKDQAIKKALAEASAPEMSSKGKKGRKADSEGMGKMRFGFGRIILAISCAAVAVFAVAYFVNLNMPDISLKVAAMQTGINASYPNYVPRDFAISSISSEDGKVVLNFKNSNSGDAFSITEETSSWDSNALLTNYVKDAFKDNYSIIREQGLTIYTNDGAAAWVNGGIVYKINISEGSLTNKQIRSIATSL